MNAKALASRQSRLNKKKLTFGLVKASTATHEPARSEGLNCQKLGAAGFPFSDSLVRFYAPQILC